jgi:hypothetical protein
LTLARRAARERKFIPARAMRRNERAIIARNGATEMERLDPHTLWMLRQIVNMYGAERLIAAIRALIVEAQS